MRIIVDDDRSFGFAHLGEAALNSLEPLEPCNNILIGDPELERDGNGGKRILDIVAPRDRNVHSDRSSLTVLVEDQCVEVGAARHGSHVLRANVGKRGKTVGHDAPVTDPADQILNLWMVDANNRKAIERHVLDELDKRVLHCVEASIMFEMLGVDVRDHRDRSVEPQKASIAFVCLDHPPVAFAEPAFDP